MDAFIHAVAYALPERVVSNDDLQRENADWDMARIADKVGIRQRHVAGEHETSSDLAYAAARKLLDAGVVDPSAVDALIFCTQTPDHLLPTSACLLQHRLGLGVHVAAFDFNQGCSGYVYGLALAKGMIAAGLARRVLFLTGETYSKLIHPRDRTIRVLFGDAGSATLITDEPGGARIGTVVLGSDGSGAQNLIVPAGGARSPHGPDTRVERTDEIGCTRTDEHLYMNGQAITTFALQRVPALLDETLGKAQVAADDVDWFLFHQANAFMNERLRSRLKLPAERVPSYLESVGNTVGSTIPILLRETADRFAAGDRAMLVGFGVGYSWGAALLEWGDVRLA
ncbi:ketoacyl-ACP synthase III [Roseisolibacter sp. H3M3-2]|uniref:3-oxoacyl-ACP synthase III family protein n=1 Tax=Roseisolibacter sp. H3M3-2 TaxID=3031323 RepID=UPI0023DA0041|nr:ketoacyl-ACP synthase III [Roseisolibacter sp. H3M3-2]MDF1502865.1 ketoacyl-ACP synthase III [Roseisolibacter sp. H3M3-2]